MSKVTDFTNLAPQSQGPVNTPAEKEKEVPEVELKGKIEIKKKSWGSRVVSDAKKCLPIMVWSNLVPRLGEIAFDELVEFGRSIIFGQPYVPGRATSRRGSGYYFKDNRVIDYDDMYYGSGRRTKRDDRTARQESRDTLSYDEFQFTDRMDVENILAAITIEARESRRVSISDLYAIIRRELKRQRYPKEIVSLLERSDYSDENYGWYYDDLASARVGTLRNGRFYLDLPEAIAIK